MDSAGTSFAASVRMGFVIDVAGYGRRSTQEKFDLQRRVSEFVDEVLQDIGLRLADTRHHGTGDGMVVFLPSEIEVNRSLARLLRSAAETVDEDNRRYRDRMRLRMAVVIGPLGPAAIGFSGDAVVEASRMVDSEELRAALAERRDTDLVAVISDQLYGYAVGQRHTGLRAEEFQPLTIEVKELKTRGWLWSGPAVSSRPTSPPDTYVLAAPETSDCVLGIRTGPIERVRDIAIWVNSENTDMTMARINEFAISSVIRYHGSVRDAAGHVVDDVIADELDRLVAGQRPVAPGAVFVTGSGVLAETNGVRRIIHVAAVHGEPGAGFRQVRHIPSGVSNALRQAERLAGEDASLRTIIFPMLGAGVAGAPVPKTAADLVDAAVDHLVTRPGTPLSGIYFLAFTDAERLALTGVLGGHPALRAAEPGNGRVTR
jgi:O-acetyl-ADP-ribose deacetylase (regulator of RNase III)